MKSKCMLVFQLTVMLLPWSLRRLFLRKVLGFALDDQCKIGFSIIISDKVSIGTGSTVGHFNFVRYLDSFTLSANSIVGSFNWFCGTPSVSGVKSVFIMGRESALTSRHYVDCIYGVEVGDFTTIAGVRSTIFSHSMDLKNNKQSGDRVRIGSYVFVGSNSVILPGACIGNKSIVAAGTTIPKGVYEDHSLLRGQKLSVTAISEQYLYFSREEGYVK